MMSKDKLIEKLGLNKKDFEPKEETTEEITTEQRLEALEKVVLEILGGE